MENKVYVATLPSDSTIVEFEVTSSDCIESDASYTMAVSSTSSAADLSLISFDSTNRRVTWYSSGVIQSTTYTVTITGQIVTDQPATYTG